MQPIELFFSRIRRLIPQCITLGEDENGNQIQLLLSVIGDKHWNIKGKTGQGKSSFLILLICTLLSLGYRVILIDPMGGIYDGILNYYAFLARQYKKKGEKSFQWYQRVLSLTKFWDLSNENHAVRHNPLEPLYLGETISGIIGRMIKFFDAYFSNQSGNDGMELQRLRRSMIVAVVSIFAVTKTPLMMARDFIRDGNFRHKMLAQARQLIGEYQVKEAIGYLDFLSENFRGNSYAEKLITTETGLGAFYEGCNPIISTSKLRRSPFSIGGRGVVLPSKKIHCIYPSTREKKPPKKNHFFNMLFFPKCTWRFISQIDETPDSGFNDTAATGKIVFLKSRILHTMFMLLKIFKG